MSIKELDISPGSVFQIAVTPTLMSTTPDAIERFTPSDRGCYREGELPLKVSYYLLKSFISYHTNSKRYILVYLTLKGYYHMFSISSSVFTIQVLPVWNVELLVWVCIREHLKKMQLYSIISSVSICRLSKYMSRTWAYLHERYIEIYWQTEPGMYEDYFHTKWEHKTFVKPKIKV